VAEGHYPFVAYWAFATAHIINIVFFTNFQLTFNYSRLRNLGHGCFFFRFGRFLIVLTKSLVAPSVPVRLPSDDTQWNRTGNMQSTASSELFSLVFGRFLSQNQ
jgi:hypothetical protein